MIGKLDEHLRSLGHNVVSVRSTDGKVSVVLAGSATALEESNAQADADAWVPTRADQLTLQDALVLLAHDPQDPDAAAIVADAAQRITDKLK